MKLKGYNARRVRAFAWRNADPSRDVDLDGRPLESHYVTIVRMKDCYIYKCKDESCSLRKHDADGETHEHYTSKNARQAFPLAMGGTWYGYREWKWDKRAHLWTMEIYFVRDGYVYKAISKRDKLPEHVRVRLFERGVITTGGEPKRL